MAHQVLDPLNHGIVGPMQLRGLLLITTLGYRGLGQQHQAVVDVGLYDHLVISPAVPLVGADGCDVRDWAVGLKLEVVGVNQD
jgi:hypothetical protein